MLSGLTSFQTITDLVEQKSKYLGFQVFRHRNFSPEGVSSPPTPLSSETQALVELQKLGPAARGTIYIQLARFPTHYLVIVITHEDFRYALISVKVLNDTLFGNLIMEDIGWLDVRRIRGSRSVGAPGDAIISPLNTQGGQQRHCDADDSIQDGPLREDR